MKNLSRDWIIEPHIDFEYKKYILLAYLQEVELFYKQNKLFPLFHDLYEHYHQLTGMNKVKEGLSSFFPKELEYVDLVKKKLKFASLFEDDCMLKEIQSVIAYALPKLKEAIEEGKRLKKILLDSMLINPIGLVPLYQKEGYLLLTTLKEETNVYEYRLNSIEHPEKEKKYMSVAVNYVSTYGKSIQYTFEYIKTDLLKTNKKMPNPATYLVETNVDIPYEEALLPIAKEKLFNFINKQE